MPCVGQTETHVDTLTRAPKGENTIDCHHFGVLFAFYFILSSVRIISADWS